MLQFCCSVSLFLFSSICFCKANISFIIMLVFSAILLLIYFWWPVIFVSMPCEIVPAIFYCPSITSLLDFVIVSCIFEHLAISLSYFALMLFNKVIEVADAVSILSVLLFWLTAIASANYFSADFANFTLSYNILVVDDSIELCM